MDRDVQVKRLTRVSESCSRCGLPELACLCRHIASLKTKAKFWIIISSKELGRPSNTGRLLKLINPDSTEIFPWERTNPPLKLIENIRNNPGRTFVLYPAESELETAGSSSLKTDGSPGLTDGEGVAFILIDGTWNEAKKILRKSDYLKDLPYFSLKAGNPSRYSLRRGGRAGTLCTIEAAREALLVIGETEHANRISDYFQRFLVHYEAGRSAYAPRE